MTVPRVTGDRIGLVIGSSLDTNPYPVVARLDYEVDRADGTTRAIPLDDCGDFVVLSRHGASGTTPAHLVDHHANVRALCAAGCGRVLALGSAGGLHPHLGPGTVLAPDDFLAFSTYPTFHTTTDGYRMAGFDLEWRQRVLDAWKRSASTSVIDGGTYAMVRGPRFETRAEIRALATNADLVGMTLAAECVLAGEAGLAYAAVCKVDNLANGVAGHDLTVEEFRANCAASAESFASDVAAVLATLAAN